MENNLIYAEPESLGVSCAAVEAFLRALEEKRLCMHGFMLLRHGKVAAEGYWPPFGADGLHRVYSVSKSFTGAAVGMLVGQGKLSLDDRPSDIFPEYVPENAHRFVLQAAVRDLLRMATYNQGTSYTPADADYTRTFFTDERPKHKPGCVFNYDTAATTVLCAIVEKLSGKKMIDFMRPVLDEIGFSKDAWCVETPEGRSWTGSGILCSVRDMARFALLCMNKGEWNGKQLISREFMEAATSKQIENAVVEGSTHMSYGYGYQFWMLKDGGFAMNGMGGQFALCMPKYDAVLVTTADIQGHAGAQEAIFDAYFTLLETFEAKPLPKNMQAVNSLKKRIEGLFIPVPTGERAAPCSLCLCEGQKYILEENKAGMKWLRLVTEKDKCRLQYENASGRHELVFGMGYYEHQLFGEKYFGRRIGVRDAHYKCMGAAAWAGNTLNAVIYAIDDYLGSVKFRLTFSNGEVCGHMVKAAERFFEEYQGFIQGRVE